MNTVNSDAFQQMLLQLRNTFLEDMSEKLDRLDQLLVAMEGVGVDSDSFDEFYRIIHSLKGNGGTKYTPALITISLNYVDLLRMALEQVHAGNTSFPPPRTAKSKPFWLHRI